MYKLIYLMYCSFLALNVYFMQEPIRDNVEFDKWIKNIIDNLNLQVGQYKYFSTKSLNNHHWKIIWEIYDNCKAELLKTQTKEVGSVWENSSYIAKLIILEAHDTDSSEILQWQLMNHYINIAFPSQMRYNKN
ncbi:hypothetical protein NIES2101_29515 [Calothrix sp. HK-06]|nr:hypothetical protein NIES2101_29515 [Calothrix sp. HK-06]